VNPRQRLEEWAVESDETLLFADGFDDAIIGVGSRCNTPPLVIYDTQKCIATLMERDGMDYEGAVEFLDFNTLNAWVGEQTPVFLVTPWAPTFGIPPEEEA